MRGGLGGRGRGKSLTNADDFRGDVAYQNDVNALLARVEQMQMPWRSLADLNPAPLTSAIVADTTPLPVARARIGRLAPLVVTRPCVPVTLRALSVEGRTARG